MSNYWAVKTDLVYLEKTMTNDYFSFVSKLIVKNYLIVGTKSHSFAVLQSAIRMTFLCLFREANKVIELYRRIYNRQKIRF